MGLKDKNTFVFSSNTQWLQLHGRNVFIGFHPLKSAQLLSILGPKHGGDDGWPYVGRRRFGTERYLLEVSGEKGFAI